MAETPEKTQEITPRYLGGMPRLRLATAYVPPQVIRELFRPVEALRKGTLFPELYSPYAPGKDSY